MSGDYQLVPLANGDQTLFSASYGEKMHPGLGPSAEAELLYVRQLNIRERVQKHRGPFVIWDIGLGAAANAIAALRAVANLAGELHLYSFDNTGEPLEFALKNAAALGYVTGYENALGELLQNRHAKFHLGPLQVHWNFELVDFPAWLERRAPNRNVGETAPHAIFYDAFSPAKNPAMWTLPVFENLFRALDPARPCALTTYSRSTMIRATLLLAGFFTGVGHATGMKEETTMAANSLDLINEPLDARWLERAARSDSAAPMRSPVYSRGPLPLDLLDHLRHCPQFQRTS